MAINKSDIVTSADDSSSQAPRGHNAPSREVSGLATLSGAAADNDVVLFCEVPVDCLLDEVIFASDDLGTTGDVNIGFYPGRGSGVTIEDDSDAVDEDAIGTAVDVNAAAVAPTDLRFETKGIETVNQRAWELAGLSSKPDYSTFYIAATFSEASTAGGDLFVKAKFRQ